MLRQTNFQRNRRTSVRAASLGGMIILLATLALTPAVQAAIYTVTKTTTDVLDPGTLNWAIDQANTNAGFDEIHFAIDEALGPDPWWVIQPDPGSLMPTITDMVLIDGYTQLGTRPNGHDWATGDMDEGTDAVLMVVLDGSLAGPGAMGLDLQASGSRIRGLCVVHFADLGSAGIRITGENAGGNQVDGCFIGVLPDGETIAGSETGVWILGSSTNLIGGLLAEHRNMISTGGVSGYASGVHVETSLYTTIEGNLIGTRSDGLAPLTGSIGGAGIWIDRSWSNVVGGSYAESRNVIGNHEFGVLVYGGAYNLLHGNYIGTNLNGDFGLAMPIGNGDGVRINDSRDNEVGGDMLGNVIARNGKGVVVVDRGLSATVTGNFISQNSIARNDALGIDLEDDGVTPNDPGDVDLGANERQNFPRLLKAIASITGTGKLHVSGYLRSKPWTDYRVEFFASKVCDPSGFGEGARYLGALDPVSTGYAGLVGFGIDLAGAEVDEVITATATDPQNSTSEFSRCRIVLPGISVKPVDPDLLPYRPGGLVSLNLPLVNESSLEAYEVTASLQSEDEDLTVVSDTATYTVLPAYGVATSTDDFLLEIADGGLAREYIASLVISYLVDGVEFEEITPVILSLTSVSSVEDPQPGKRPHLSLMAAPNPANPGTNISFRLPTSARVQLRMYDAAGRLIRELASESLSAGLHTYRWDGLNRQGRPVATGIYYYRLTADGAEEVGKVTIMK